MLNKTKNYDVIIIGSGPSGLSSILYLLQANITNICLITASNLNYHKTCSGYLTEKSIQILKDKLNIDVINDLNYLKATNFTGYYQDKIFYEGNESDKYVYYSPSLNRECLDNYLVKLVREKNIDIYENTTIKDIDFKNNTIYSKNQSWHFKNLILADGENSLAKKYTKQPKKRKIGFEIKTTTKDTTQELKIKLVLGLTKRGYAWVTKKDGYSTIGFTDLYNKNINYIELLTNFANKEDLNINKKDIRGAFIPCGLRKLNLSHNIYCTGDAAGLADSLNQEGIYYSLISSFYACQAIIKNNYKLYKKYMHNIIANIKLSSLAESIFFKSKIQNILWRHKVKDKSLVKYLMKEYLTTTNFHYKKALKYFYKYKTQK